MFTNSVKFFFKRLARVKKRTVELTSQSFPFLSQLKSKQGFLNHFSMGEIVPRPAPPTPVVPLPQAAPNHIVSIPSKFQFINFKVGQLHTVNKITNILVFFLYLYF